MTCCMSPTVTPLAKFRVRPQRSVPEDGWVGVEVLEPEDPPPPPQALSSAAVAKASSDE
jgi:hypothetical protein